MDFRDLISKTPAESFDVCKSRKETRIVAILLPVAVDACPSLLYYLCCPHRYLMMGLCCFDETSLCCLFHFVASFLLIFSSSLGHVLVVDVFLALDVRSAHLGISVSFSSPMRHL